MKTHIFHNGQLPGILKLVSDNNGFNPDLKETQQYKDYQQAMDHIKSFDGKKVDLTFTSENDFMTSSGTKNGKIKVVEDRIRFYEGRVRNKFYYLDAGLYMGWYATLIPLNISA